MPDRPLSDWVLFVIFTLSVLIYGFDDVLSTYLALSYNEYNSDGMPISAVLVNGGLNGYILLLALKLLGLLMILGIAFFRWKILAKWLLGGFAIYGAYLTVSNVNVFLTGYPLLPPGDPQIYAQLIWMIVLPFMAIGFGFETWDSIQIWEGKKEGYVIWGQEIKWMKARRSRSSKNR